MIDEYRNCARICALVEYGDKESVKRNNQAVSRMYEIVQRVAIEGAEEIKKLAMLLDEPESSKWLAHQLVEITELPMNLENKCFEIIEKLAQSDSADALGEKWWLDEWKNKKAP